MHKKNSKSIKNYFTPKRQHASDSEATTSTHVPNGESRSLDSPRSSKIYEGQSEPGMTEDTKRDESLTGSTCDSLQESVKTTLKKDNDEHFNEQIDKLTEGGRYYWKNFLSILTGVLGNDNLKNLFSAHELSVLKDFNDLNPEEQMLYVRLLNRKHSWIKTSSIKYVEINSDIDSLIKTLIEKGFLYRDVSEEETRALLNLMPLQEIRSLCKCFHLRSGGKKEYLVRSLIDFGHCQKSIHRGISRGIKSLIRERATKALGKMIKLCCTPRKLLLRIMLLHALPLGHDMEMDGRIPILNEMSRVRSNQITYPEYPLHPLKNFFGSSDSLIRFQEALELLALTKGKMLNKCYGEVLPLYEMVIKHLRRILGDSRIRKEDVELPRYLRSFTAGYALARAVIISIECLKAKKMYSEVVESYKLLLSQDLYVAHHRGKWYDQLALIHHHHLKDVPAAIDVLMEGLNDDSLSLVDKLLLSNRGIMLANRKTKTVEDIDKNNNLKSLLSIVKNPPEINITATCLSSKIGLGSKLSYMNKSSDGTSHVLSSVEESVIQHHKLLGFDKGIHAENAVSMSIFGIFFWDIIYLIDVDNVFICPYQHQPLDLKSGEFYQNRKDAIDKRLKEMEEVWTIDTMKEHLRKVCSQEQGKESIVSWRTFDDVNGFEQLMECVGLPVISKICKRMAMEFSASRRGFPDVIIWNSASKKCKFLEVKGPGDRLSPSQIIWLNYLNDSGAEAAVCHVTTLGSKSLKRKYDTLDDTDSMPLE